MVRLKSFLMSLRLLFPVRQDAGATGASLIEYVLLLSLVLIVAIGAMKFFGLVVSGSLANTGNDIANAAGHG